jgi:hypothetical protein
VAPPREVAKAVQQMEASGCWSDPGMNYNSHAHQMEWAKAPTVSACCAKCGETHGCVAFTYLTGNKECLLKNSTTGRSHLAGAISGGPGTKPALPPVAPHGRPSQGACDQVCYCCPWVAGLCWKSAPLTMRGGWGSQGVRVNGGGQPCLWWSQGCSIGCEKCATDIIGPNGSAGGSGAHKDKIGFGKRFCNASFNSAGAPAPMINSTLPREAWTMNVNAVEGAEEDPYRFNPWRARECQPDIIPWRCCVPRSAD